MELFGFDFFFFVCIWFRISLCVFFLVFGFVVVLFVICFSFPDRGIVDLQSICVFPWR